MALESAYAPTHGNRGHTLDIHEQLMLRGALSAVNAPRRVSVIHLNMFALDMELSMSSKF